MNDFEILTKQLENLGSRKILFVLEGRDASGKGGFVKYLNANDISYLYLHQGRGTATRQKKWLSDYKKEILSLPKGKLIIYDRSWHTRTWYHYPLGYCTKRQYNNQLRNVFKWERNLIENPYGNPSDVILTPDQQGELKTDLLRSGIAAIKKYLSFSKGGLVSPQTLYENGISSMFRRV